MDTKYDLKAMRDKIATVRKTMMELKEMSPGFPSVERNSERILADVRVLELVVADVVDIING